VIFTRLGGGKKGVSPFVFGACRTTAPVFSVMILIAGLCLSYSPAAASAGSLRCARLVQRNENGSWRAAPLLPAEGVDAALIPIAPVEAALRLVDGAIREIPALVLDGRAASQLLLSAAVLASSTPVLVANENWFRSLHALYRDGMEGVYSIVHAFTDAPTTGKRLHLPNRTHSALSSPLLLPTSFLPPKVAHSTFSYPYNHPLIALKSDPVLEPVKCGIGAIRWRHKMLYGRALF
jgi:hypothetical protein